MGTAQGGKHRGYRLASKRLILAALLIVLAVSLFVASTGAAKGATLASGSLEPLSASSFPNQPPASGSEEIEDATEEPERIPGHYIVVFRNSVEHPGNLAEAQTEARGADLNLVYRHALKGYSAELSKADVEVLRRTPQVRAVVPDQIVHAEAQTIPTGVKRTFDTENSVAGIDGVDTRVNADVAVIDTGVDYTHPDLNVYKRVNCVPPSEDPIKDGSIEECVENSGTDGEGHGTHVAGIIGALDNGEGVVGVAPGVRIWSVKVLNSEGAGSLSWIVAGIDYVAAHSSEIEVANMSLGCEPCLSEVMEEAISGYQEGGEHVPGAVDKGVVFTVAAGNSNHEVANGDSPAADPDVITVSALADSDGAPGSKGPESCDDDQQGLERLFTDDTLAWFSDYGPKVDIAAPGVCILSTLPGGKYGTLSGTSMAAPHVAGAAAILASESNPNSKADVEAISRKLIDRGSLNWADGGSGPLDSRPDPPEPVLYLGAPLSGTEVATGGAVPELHSAAISAAVNSRGLKTEYQFEYGPTVSYGSTAPTTPKVIAAGTNYIAVEETLGSLSARTTYHYRVKAINSAGTFYGNDRTFTTPGVVGIQGAKNITEHEATLFADGPKEKFSTAEFEYGLTTAYGHSVTAEADKELPGWHAPINGLDPATVYHYRLVAKNSEETAYSTDQRVRTAAWSEESAAASEEGRQGSLRDIACPAENNCMAVGGGDSVGVADQNSYVEHWTGGKWIGTAFALEPNANHQLLSGVSCASTTNCVAVGYIYNECTVNFGSPCEFRAIAREWNGTTWQNAALPVPGEASNVLLEAVSCVSPTWCTAAGGYELKDGSLHYLLMRWNGEKWSQLSTPQFLAVIPRDISCTSTSDCWIVGSGRGVLHWNGEKWSTVRLPRGASEALHSVSCVSSSACLAVGSGGSIVQWDGTKWSTIEDPKGMPQWVSNLTSISCTAAWSCSAVGETEYTAIVEHREFRDERAPGVFRWDGSEWSAESTSLPATAQQESSLAAISCFSTSSCTSVGVKVNQPEPGSREVSPLAEHYKYSVSAPVVRAETASAVSPTGATLNARIDSGALATTFQFEYDTKAYGVGEGAHGTVVPASAKDLGSSAKSIIASESISGLKALTTYHFRVRAKNALGSVVGPDESFTTIEPCKLGEGKCGWKSQSTPNLTTSTYNLTGVSCASASMCFAVGTDQLQGKGQGELWNGSEWSTLISNTKAGNGTSAGVSCPSSALCVGVGSYEGEPRAWRIKEEAGKWTPSFESPPIPSGGSKSSLRSVSCSSTTACTAVGSYYVESEKTYRPLVERWNGTTWALQTAPGAQNKMLGVSCSSGTACMAVGANEGFAIAEVWNGVSWSEINPPNPGTLENTLEGISCNSASACIATGSYKETGKGVFKRPLAERWNGTEWTVLSVPIPTEAKGEATLTGISCASTSSCTAVGRYSPEASSAPAEFRTLVEYWDGAKWAIQASPNSSLKGSSLTAVSCSSAIACTAVGNASPEPSGTTRFGEVSLAERYE